MSGHLLSYFAGFKYLRKAVGFGSHTPILLTMIAAQPEKSSEFNSNDTKTEERSHLLHSLSDEL